MDNMGNRKLQLKQANSKLQETMRQASLTLTKVKELVTLLRGTEHSPDLKRVEMYLSKAKETLMTTSKTLKSDIAQLSDVPTSEAPTGHVSGRLPQVAIILIGVLCGAGIFSLSVAGISAVSTLPRFLRQSMPGWFLLALIVEAGVSFAAGYIAGVLSLEKSTLNTIIVGGILAGFALLLFGYRTSWHSLYVLIPLLSCIIGGLGVAQKQKSSTSVPEQSQESHQQQKSSQIPPSQPQTANESE